MRVCARAPRGVNARERQGRRAPLAQSPEGGNRNCALCPREGPCAPRGLTKTWAERGRVPGAGHWGRTHAGLLPFAARTPLRTSGGAREPGGEALFSGRCVRATSPFCSFRPALCSNLRGEGRKVPKITLPTFPKRQGIFTPRGISPPPRGGRISNFPRKEDFSFSQSLRTHPPSHAKRYLRPINQGRKRGCIRFLKGSPNKSAPFPATLSSAPLCCEDSVPA